MTIVHKYSSREFTIWHGGKFIEGKLKWVISTEDREFFEFTDGLWATKKEAFQAVQYYLNSLDK